MDFNSIEDFIAYAQKEINNVLETDVAPVVESTLKDNIDRNVYNSYSPVDNGYIRRHQLDNPSNIISELETDGVLATMDIADSNVSIVDGSTYSGDDETSFSTMINDGLVHNLWDRDYPFLHPAMYIEDSITELQSTGKVDKALTSGLKGKGFDITSSIGIG